MKTHRPYPMAFITPKGERACRAGHPWVYDAEVERIVEAGDPKEAARTWKESIESGGITPENGALVDVLSRKGAYLGTGIFSQQSKIRIRLLSTNANDAFDSAFWERKIRWAWNHRRAVMGDDVSACRMIFSEADGFCGLVVDRFNDVLVTQTLAYGMERLKPVVFPLLVKVLAEDGVVIRGIYERNDVSTRKLEGLQQSCGWFPLENDFAGLGAQPALSAVPRLSRQATRPQRHSAPPRPKSSKTACATMSISKTARKPVSSSTRNTTAAPWPISPAASRARLLYAHGFVRPKRCRWAKPSTCMPSTSLNSRSTWQNRMPA